MPTVPTVPGGRPIPVATRLSTDEAAWLDRARGSLTRAQYLRALLVKERRAHQAQHTDVTRS